MLSKKLAHFPVQFKEMFAVCAGLIGYIVAPCDNNQKAYSSHLKILPQKGKGEISIIPEQKGKEV